ncbi:MAG: diphthine synthase [Thermoplasmata archaeon]
MLTLVGLGLNPKKHLTLEGIEKIKNADELYLEMYTSRLMDTSKGELENFLGKRIEIIDRKTVESDFLLNVSSNRNIVLLVPGDPMMATTHIELKISAFNRSIPFEVVNGISIQCVIPSILGLQNYKFGRSVSIPFPDYDYYPRSVYDFIAGNKKMGLHTLTFLDLREDLEMSAVMAFDILLKMEELYRQDIINEDTIVAVISRAGSSAQKAVAGKIKKLFELPLGPTPQILVIIGNLHYMEKEALEKFASLKE